MVAQTKRISLDEFMALPNDGNRHELVRGEVRTMPPPKGEHGLIESAITEELGRYLRETALAVGWEPGQGRESRNRLVGFVASGEFGLRFSIPDDPTQVRGADVVYVPAKQFASVSWDRSEYFPTVPQLVVEVVSPSESADDVAEKVQDYLAGGAHRVWCVYPRRHVVHIYDIDGPMRFVGAGGNLTDEELLPGFSLPLNLIFSDLP